MSRFTELSAAVHFQAVEEYGSSLVLDVGCGDGARVRSYLPVSHVAGIDGYLPACKAAHRAGIAVVQADLERRWPIASESVDVVSANQVIEHLSDTDLFVDECYRVLKPGGTAVISTENLAAWPNIAALIAGQEPFSSNYSKRVWLGNRFSRRAGRPLEGDTAAFPHRSVGSYQALVDLFAHSGFRRVGALGIHILPLPALLLRWLRRIDVRHAMYITLVFTKPAHREEGRP